MKCSLSIARRAAWIFWVCSRHLLAHIISESFGRYELSGHLRFVHTYSGPQRLRMALQQIGGTFIKFGQVLALQSDILSLDYCHELFNLLDRVPPFSYEEVERTFLHDLGRKPCDIYDSFVRDPIATGSIGQVHVATLGRRKLAVKVRRPSVLDDFGSDIRLMMFTVKLIAMLRLKAFYWMIAPISEFVAWTREELDYRREARYMDAIARNSRETQHEVVPNVLWELTTERILTAEFLEALTVLDYMRARDACNVVVLNRFESVAFDPPTFARNMIENFLGDAFQYGVFHADLHPANLLVMPSSCVGYIDFGIAGVLSTYSRHHLIAMTLAYTRGDLDQMCDSFFHISAMDSRSRPDKFRSQLKKMAQSWYVRGGDGVHLRKSITVIMLELLTLSRATGIWPQRDVVKYIRSAIALDGLIKSFAPGFDVGRHLECVCDRHLHWQPLRNLMMPHAVLSCLEAASRLARDGMPRTIARMYQPQQPPKPTPASRKPDRLSVVRISIIALLASILASAPESTWTPSVNVRSATFLLAIVSIIWAIWRMIRARRTGCVDTSQLTNIL